MKKKLHRITHSKKSYINILFLKSVYANINIYYKNGPSVWTQCRQTITYCPLSNQTLSKRKMFPQNIHFFYVFQQQSTVAQ